MDKNNRATGADDDGESATELSHVDESGRVRMVEIGGKPLTERVATACGRITANAQTIELIERQAIGKGDVVAVARIAGIMAAKRTSELIPLCHPLFLSHVDVQIDLDASGAIDITATARTEGKTGVEMEALTGVSVAALTIYDMCKAVDRGMVIRDICLTHKAGGRSGEWRRQDD